MDVYEAINKMRALSKVGKPFSFGFMSYSEDRATSHGIVEVQNARLRKQSTTEQDKNADIKLNYFNLDTCEYGSFYQPLLMEFNGERLVLS